MTDLNNKHFIIAPLNTRKEINAAISIFAQNITALNPNHIKPQSTYPATAHILHQNHFGLPGDIWLGAWNGRHLVGAVHATVPQEAEDVATSILNRVPNSGGPGWLVAYARKCAVISEIAVTTSSQRRGIGEALVSRLHDALKADPSREINVVTACLTSTQPHPLFRSAGYTIGAPGQPVPPEYALGIRSQYDPFDMGSASHCWAYKSIQAD